MKKVYLLICLTILSSLGAHQVSISNSWAYQDETVYVTVKVKENPQLELEHVTLRIKGGEFNLLDSRVNNSYSYDLNAESGDSFLNYTYELYLLDEGEYNFYADLLYEDATEEVTDSIDFTVLKKPELLAESFINVWSVDNNISMDDAYSCLIEVFSNGKNQISENDISLNSIVTGRVLDSLPTRTILYNSTEYSIYSYPFIGKFREEGDKYLLRDIDRETIQAPVVVTKSSSYSGMTSHNLDYKISNISSSAKRGEKVTFYIELTSNNFFDATVDMLEELKLPNYLMKKVTPPIFKWDGDRVVVKQEHYFHGINLGFFGLKIPSLSLPYFNSSLNEEQILELSSIVIPGNLHSLAVIVFIVLLAIIGFATYLFITYSVRKAKNKSETNGSTEVEVDEYIEEFAKEYNLTPREKDIFNVLINGKSTKEIADTLYISPDTAKKHINNIMKKTSIHSRIELVVLFSDYTKQNFD